MTSPSIADWPRPLRMLACLLSTDLTAATNLVPAMNQTDWDAFARLAVERHRLGPLVLDRLSIIDPPAEILNLLEGAAQQNAVNVLHQVSAVRAIRKTFENDKVPFAVLKGWPLSEELFANGSSRHARDIDLLIDPSQLRGASNALQGLGFLPTQEHAWHHTLIGHPSLLDELNNLSFSDPETGVMVELHWRCNQFKGWPEPFEGLGHIGEHNSSIGTISVPCEQQNLIYLSIHGSLHRWSRLKWLYDVAKLAERRGHDQLEQDMVVADNKKAGRPFALGLFLANQVFGTPCPKTTFTRDCRLPRQCLVEIARPEAVPSSLSHRLKFYAMMFALAEGIAQHAGILRYRFWGKPRLTLASRRHSA